MNSDNDSQSLDAAIAAFNHKMPTTIHDHGRECCLCAKEWLLAMDRSFRRSQGQIEPPIWLREHFKWGPSPSVLYWCELVQRASLDDSMLAALNRECFRARGVAALPAQMINYYSEQEIEQWATKWANEVCHTDWIHGSYTYSEAAAVIRGETIQIWNPRENFWFDPELQFAYAKTVAMRIVATSTGLPSVLQWGKYCLTLNSWQSAPGLCISVSFDASINLAFPRATADV